MAGRARLRTVHKPMSAYGIRQLGTAGRTAFSQPWAAAAAARRTGDAKDHTPDHVPGTDQSRLSLLQDWVLQNEVTEIEMNERQFWNFVSVQPVAEKPWTTFMGRMLHVSDMPVESQKCLGIFDKRTPGTI